MTHHGSSSKKAKGSDAVEVAIESLTPPRPHDLNPMISNSVSDAADHFRTPLHETRAESGRPPEWLGWPEMLMGIEARVGDAQTDRRCSATVRAGPPGERRLSHADWQSVSPSGS